MSYIKLANYYNEENNEYYCVKCDYNTSRKYNFIQHLETKKHKTGKTSKTSNEQHHECDCGKSYMHRQGLYLHRKKGCNYTTNIKNEISELKNLILQMSKQNMATLINKSNISNSFNNKNEIKIFLTEQCANALSIQDFVKQLTITLEDINTTKESNVCAITSILERNLNPLSLTTRPIHYVEKDEWYLKDNEKWKEDDANEFIDKAYNKYQNECIVESSAIELNDDEYIKVIVLVL